MPHFEKMFRLQSDLQANQSLEIIRKTSSVEMLISLASRIALPVIQ